MSDLLELAARVEAARPSQQREMLKLAYEAVFGGPENVRIDRWPGYASPRWDRFHKMLDVAAFESAAMMLVPENCLWNVGCAHDEKFGACVSDYLVDTDYPDVTAATPALALCAAALKARAAS